MALGAPAGMTGKRVFRSTAARVSGWAWLVFAAVNMVDLAMRGRDSAALIAAAVLLLGCGIAYVIGLRPRVVADETGVRVHNPLRDIVVPWSALEKIAAPGSLRITYTGSDGERHEARSWVLQTSPRERAKAERRAARSPEDDIARYVMNRTPADFAAEQLTELAEAHRRTSKASTGAAQAGAAPTGAADTGGSGGQSGAGAADTGGTGGTGAAGSGSGDESAGRVNWWPPAVVALVGPALLLIGVVLAVTLR
jgi:hypothetical protein